MGTKEVYRKKLDEEGNLVIENGDFVMELVESKHEPDLPALPDWLALEQGLRYSSVFGRRKECDPIDFNIFTTTLINGKRGDASENALAFGFSILGLDWTEEERALINDMLKKYHFTITI